MSNYFKELITILLSVVTITGLIIWLAKELIKKLLQADLERQRNKLQLENYRYTKLQNEQFDTIKHIYANLIQIEELLKESFEMIKNREEFTKKKIDKTLVPLIKIIFDTQRYYKQNSIFLSEPLCLKISKVIDTIFFCLTNSAYAVVVKSKEIFNGEGKYLGLQEIDFSELTETDKIDFQKTIKDIEVVRNNELPEAIKLLQTEFRLIFGVK